MTRTMVSILVFCLPLSALAEPKEGMDYQFRFLLHAQRVASNGIGVAGWGIVPDALNTKTPVGVILGGVVFKQKDRWVEGMVGTFLNGHKVDDPLLDIRASDTRSKMVHFFGEARYSLKTDTLMVSPAITFPIYTVQGKMIGVGAESDMFLTRGRLRYGLGPRLAFQLPIKGWTFATAYQFQPEQDYDILRSYFVISF